MFFAIEVTTFEKEVINLINRILRMIYNSYHLLKL